MWHLNKFLIIGVMIFSMVTILPTVKGAFPSSGLVAYYTLDDSVGNFVDNVSANNLIPTGAAWTRQNGKIEKELILQEFLEIF